MRIPWLLAFAAAFAQDQPPTAQPVASPITTLRITVTLVQVDAVVTDSHGRHVMDLGPGDFEILQDGEPQPVTFFSRIAGEKPQPGPEGAPVLKPDGIPAPVTSTALTSAAQVKRAIALVVDDLALTFEDLVHTRDALKRYVTTQMLPGDVVAIVRTGGGVAILEQFTSDKRVLLEAIDTLKWRFNGRQGLGPIRPRPGDAGPNRSGDPEFLDYGYTLSALGALGTVEQVIHGMKMFPGRKSVVFLSDNLRVDGSIHAAIDHLTDLANRSMVSLYAIDPGGLRADFKGMKQDPVLAGRDTESLERFPGFPGAELDDETARQEGLEALAGRTGGLFYRNRNDIEGCITEAADDQLGYYVLGYSPKEGTFDQKFHKLTVRVKRPGLKVRWKSGFSGVPDTLVLSEMLSKPLTREQQLLDALASPFKATGLAVRLTSMYAETPKSGPVVYSMLHFAGKDLAFRKEPDGDWHASVDIVWVAYSGVNRPMWQGEKPQDIRLDEEHYRQALRDGFMVPFSVRAAQPGTFLLRTVVRDTASERIGSASQYVDVPDTRKGKLGLSGITLRKATSEILKDMGEKIANPDEEWTQGGPAIRRFRPGQAILYGYWIINPKPKGSQKTPQVATALRVFRDGRLIYSGPESHHSSDKMPDNKLVVGGLLRLGTGLTPGEYLVQVIVRDANRGKKAPPLTQWIDFEVTRG